MKLLLKRALLSTLLAGAGLAVFAQGMGGMGGMPHEDMHPGMGPGMHKPDPAKMQVMMDKHHAALKAKLKLTPEQEGAWSTFTTAMKPPATMGHNRPDPAEMQKLTTPERIDKMRALRAEHQGEMDKRADAVKAFYTTLSADQKKVFDAEHQRHGRKSGTRGPGAGMKGAPAPAVK